MPECSTPGASPAPRGSAQSGWHTSSATRYPGGDSALRAAVSDFWPMLCPLVALNRDAFVSDTSVKLIGASRPPSTSTATAQPPTSTSQPPTMSSTPRPGSPLQCRPLAQPAGLGGRTRGGRSATPPGSLFLPSRSVARPVGTHYWRYYGREGRLHDPQSMPLPRSGSDRLARARFCAPLNFESAWRDSRNS
jgi:hypothetical protein